MTSKEVKNLNKHLLNGIAAAKGVDGDFVYITIGDAKRIVQMIAEHDPKPVLDILEYRGKTTGYCPNCKLGLYKDTGALTGDITNHCPKCGQAVKWNNEQSKNMDRPNANMQ